MANMWGWGLRLGSGGVVILAPGPTNTVAPVASGTAEVGETLSCTTGTWEGEGVLSYAYQWLRDSASIGSATANAYTLVEADEGALISCRVTATDDNGSRSRTSNALGPVVDPSAAGVFAIGVFEEGVFDASAAGVFAIGVFEEGVFV